MFHFKYIEVSVFFDAMILLMTLFYWNYLPNSIVLLCFLVLG